MLISSWLKSFRTLLQPRSRTTRSARRETLNQRRSPSHRVEDLEIRSLLTSPELVAISPDFGSFISDGDLLTEATRELKFQFTPGVALDANSFAGIQIVGSGFDDSFGEGNEIPIPGGFVGFGDTNSQVIFRFAESLSDDRYLITIKGTGATPLLNAGGEFFNNGVDQTVEFDLDLGAQVRAVVPQPVIRDQVIRITNVAAIQDGDQITINDGGSLVVFEFEDTAIADGTNGNPAITFTAGDLEATVAGRLQTAINTALFSGPGVSAVPSVNGVTVEGSVFTPTVTLNVSGGVSVTAGNATQLRDTVLVYFNEDPLNQADAEDPRFYRLFDTRGTLTPGDDSVFLPQSITYDSTNNYAILKFPTDLPNATYSLTIGTSNEPGSTIASASNVGTLFATTDFRQSGYVGDSGDTDVDLYQVTLEAGADLTVTVTPDASLDAAVRFFDADGTPVGAVGVVDAGGGVETFTFTAPADGTFFVGVSGSGYTDYNAVNGTGTDNAAASTGAYVLNMAVTNSISTSDDNSSFATATDLGVLGSSGQILTSQIEPQGIAQPAYPGGSDEPGHREIPAESHGAGAGTASTAPGAIGTVQYHFPGFYGNTPSGQPRFNEITENQKQRTREIYELYGKLWGFEVEETVNSGTPIITGDIRVFNPTFPLGVSLSVVLMDGSQDWGNSEYGGSWFNTALHEIGHTTGLLHSYDLPSVQGGSLNAEDQFPGSVDISHGLRVNRPDATDIDLYEFEVTAAGKFTAEIVAERLLAASTGGNKLNSALRLYREDPVNGRVLIAQNDDYFADDAYIELELKEAGTYFIGVSASGNTDYDPTISDSGFGGTSDGVYELRMNFETATVASLRDADNAPNPTDGTAFDGDGDGTPGGDFVFSFRSDNTIYVDKSVATNLAASASAATTTLSVTNARVFSEAVPFNVNIGNEVVRVTAVNTASNTLTVVRGQASTIAAAHPLRTALVPSSADGTIGRPFGLISNALSAAVAGDIVRILANGGADNNVATTNDNRPYVVGLDAGLNTLEDGDKFEVPKDVLVQIDAGAVIKLQKAIIDAGSSTQGVDHSGGAVQVLGTPGLNVYLTSARNDSLGGDSDGVTGNPQPGDWGGLVYREDSDFIATDVSTNASDSPIILNYVNQATITYGGGLVQVDGADETFTPIHLVTARPTITNNTISLSAKGAVSADPDSFSDSRGRIGPDIHGNNVTGNTTNALVIRSDSGASKLTAAARFDDTDIVHVITDNLQIEGAPGGQQDPSNPNRAVTAGRLAIDAGVIVKLSSARIEAERGGAQLIAEGTPINPVIFTSLLDDRYGAGGTFDTTGNLGTVQPSPGDWAGLVFNMVTSGSIDNAIIAYGGGSSPIAGGLSQFNAIEAQHFATLRVANSILEFNADGNAADNRDSRGTNTAATIFLRQVQPVIVNNVFTNNIGAIIDINANAMVSDVMRDPGRSTGPLDVGVPDGRDTLSPATQFADNHGPLIRQNRFADNDVNGLVVRGAKLSVESVWDDTDIVHVLQSEIIVDYHHTFSGLKLQSAVDESLVIKLAGSTAGFTADGVPLDVDDRIGGTVQILGRPDFPVVLTALNDHEVGAGLRPDGLPQNFTIPGQAGGNNPAVSGSWRSIQFNQYSNDRNVRTILENEKANNTGVDVNGTPGSAQNLGELAKDLKSGDDARPLGFEIHGFISADDHSDADVYSFQVDAGTEVWIDVDRTRGAAVDVELELVQQNGTVLARSIGANEAADLSGSAGLPLGPLLGPLTKNGFDGGDFYTTNYQDPGMRVVLPGTPGGNNETYYVRVKSAVGLTSGEYQLQIRLRQVDEKPGSIVQYADIRYATNGIEVNGLPGHSPLLADASETTANNNAFGGAQQLGNLLQTDRNTLSVGGSLSSAADVDFYDFNVDYATTVYGPSIQAIGGVNGGPKTWTTVFDLDYADGLTRADTNLVVWQSVGGQRVPVLIGRESNIKADQPVGLLINLDDLSRGSAGQLDPFIGPVQLPAGTPGSTTTYSVSVNSNQQLPTQLNQTYIANANNADIRLEPVNSVERVIEDHIGFQGYDSNGAQVDPVHTAGLVDIQDLTTTVRAFDLGDVPLFVSGNSRLETANSLAGEVTTDFGDLGNLNGDQSLKDITFRSDGTLWGYRNTGNGTDAVNGVGQLYSINPGTGAMTAVGTGDNIPGAGAPTSITPAGENRSLFDELTFSGRVDALAWERSGGFNSNANYNLYYSVQENGLDAANAASVNSKLYRANPADGSAARNYGAGFGAMGDIQPNGVSYASSTITFRDNDGDGSFGRVTIEARAPGAAGNGIQVIISRADNSTTVTNVVGNTIFVRVDNNPNGTAAEVATAINDSAAARALVTAAVTSGASGEAGAVITAAVTLAGGQDGLTFGPLLGNVTGLSFPDFHGDAQVAAPQNGGDFERLYGVTAAGEFIRINTASGLVDNLVDLTSLLPLGATGFTGLTLGPQNVNDGDLATTLFATTNNGWVLALDPTAFLPATTRTDNNPNAFIVNAFDSGSGMVDTFLQSLGTTGTTSGLAFSPLDFNLWHPTTNRGNDAGHGINTAYDFSRTPC
jgi:hypothetical protein